MRILTRPNLGGPTRQAIALWFAHRDMGVPTLLATGSVDAAEAALSPATCGVPSLAWDEALALGEAATGWVQVPHLGRGVAPLADWRAAAAIRRLLASHRPHVVHTHTSKAGWLGRRAAAQAGVPVVVHTFHGHVLQDYFGTLASAGLARLEARMARRTSVLVAVSGSCADELAAAGVAARDRFVVVPPAVAIGPMLSRGEARAELGIPRDQFRVGCIGRLVPIKRVEHFVRMVADRPDWHGDVVGEGPLRSAVAAAIAEQAPDRVRLCGARVDIARLLPAYDALVLPSVREGCPLVAVEAFAAAVPVVGYDVPGVHDVLAIWGRGLLTDTAAGPRGLAAAIDRVRHEPGLAADCITASRAAVATFAPAVIAARLLDAYGVALAGAPRYHRGPAD